MGEQVEELELLMDPTMGVKLRERRVPMGVGLAF